MLVTAPRDVKRLRQSVEKVAAELGMTVDIEKGIGDNQARREGRSHVTVIGAPLQASAMAAIAGRIADLGGNIDRIERMARYPVTAIELDVSGAEPASLRNQLAREAAVLAVDVAVQPASLLRHAVRLIVMDVDSTLIQGEVIEMIAAHAGCEAEVAAVTEAAMRGDIDFEESLRARGCGCSPVWTRRSSTPSTAPSSSTRALGPWCVRCDGSGTGSRSSRVASARSPTDSPTILGSTAPAPTRSRSSTAS